VSLTDPIAAYNAESNVEAALVQRFLESEGIEAYAAEDHSLVGHWMFGNLPEIHKPQVWINRHDAERVAELLVEYERRKLDRDAERKAGEPRTIAVDCEECGETSTFAGSLNGTTQDCPYCGGFVDVGEFDWPFEVGREEGETALIREYQEHDLPDLLVAWEAASELAHPFLSQEFLATERENIPNLYLPNAETWVAEHEGRVIGFVALLGNEVGAIFVHPHHQGEGFGRALMDKARALRGELVVEVFAANAIGRRFYANYGFELVEQRVHAQTGFELCRLRLSEK
jgi:putative acetyltransferase